jgi:hypothetical protein
MDLLSAKGGAGWILDKEDPSRPVSFRVLLDGVEIGSGTNESHRPDLTRVYATQIGGFSLSIPPGHLSSTARMLQILDSHGLPIPLKYEGISATEYQLPAVLAAAAAPTDKANTAPSDKTPKMRLVQFLNSDGVFDYERYRAIQTAANHAKIQNNWAYKPAIEFIANYLKDKKGHINSGICHGTRRGNEQAWFREYLDGADVIGTEISDTATQFPHTIQHDFHEPKSEWVGKFDFVYSNSWDHAYDPARAFSVWMESLAPSGLMILEHTMGHMPEYASPMDPFGVSFDELVEFINKCGEGRFGVVDVLDQFDFKVPEYMSFLKYCVVKVAENV